MFNCFVARHVSDTSLRSLAPARSQGTKWESARVTRLETAKIQKPRIISQKRHTNSAGITRPAKINISHSYSLSNLDRTKQVKSLKPFTIKAFKPSIKVENSLARHRMLFRVKNSQKDGQMPVILESGSKHKNLGTFAVSRPQTTQPQVKRGKVKIAEQPAVTRLFVKPDIMGPSYEPPKTAPANARRSRHMSSKRFEKLEKAVESKLRLRLSTALPKIDSKNQEIDKILKSTTVRPSTRKSRSASKPEKIKVQTANIPNSDTVLETLKSKNVPELVKKDKNRYSEYTRRLLLPTPRSLETPRGDDNSAVILKKILNSGRGDIANNPQKLQRYVKIVKKKLTEAANDGSLMKLTNTPRTHEAMENNLFRESNFPVVKQEFNVEKLPKLKRPHTEGGNRWPERSLSRELRLKKEKPTNFALNITDLKPQTKQLELLMNKTMKWVITQEFEKYQKEDILDRERMLNPGITM